MGRSPNYRSRLQGRTVSRRRFLAGGGVVAAGSAAMLAGCGGDTPSPKATGDATSHETETPPPAATEASPKTATPSVTPSPTATPTPDPYAYRRGGTLRLWKPAEDQGLDPGIYHVGNRDIIHSTLTQPLTYRPSKNLFAVDGMAGYEQVDPLTLVWSIRPGMKFHNGDPVDSEAVAFSFGRLAKLYEVRGDSHVDRRGFDFVDSFEATDELTMTEHWRRPNADALVHRARSYYSFLNPRVVEAQGVLDGTYAAADGTTEDVYSVQDLPFGSGSGPYVVAKRDENGTRVERWPDYHRHVPADDGFVEGGPYIDAWETRVIDYSYGGAREAFLRGELDVYGHVWIEELPDFEGLDHVSVSEMPSGGLSLLGMDGAKFHDRRARDALQKAIDYEGFIEAIRPLGGRYAAPVSDLLPHFQRLSQEQLQEWQRYEPEEALALWTAADFAVPIDSIKTLVSAQPVEQRIGEFVSQSLGEVLGLSTELWHTDPYCSDYRGCPPLSGRPDDLEAIVFGTGEAGGTTGVLQDSLVYYDPQGHGQRLNYSHLIESPRPEVEADALTLTAMLQAQEQEMDFDTRVELLTDVQRWILDNAWCFLQLPVSQVQHFAFSSRLRDYAPDDWATPYALRRESMWLVPS
ncbi:MAG: hypothetical protein F4081_00660 [Dehalococcoidia bacterium]|nr:hypothetical protein [Dehalococcoidia bacterium]MYI85316.1 hypothetical protein [Dehalococcoidia bacterium]